MKPLRIGIIGFGKIAKDQHLPAIAAHPRLELAATVSRRGPGAENIPCFPDHRQMIEAALDLEAVAICTPPSVRYAIARDCIEAGLHCLLEKPPTVTLGEIDDLACLAEGRQVSLFTTWHAQHNPAVTAAAEALAGKTIASMRIVWHEDVRKWHPGQEWIWEPGGFGVFDPGINALSIASKIFPGPLFVKDAELVFPENRQTPIAADLRFTSPATAGEFSASFDWRHSGGEAWTIEVVTAEDERISLSEGGSILHVNGQPRSAERIGEYPGIYNNFVDLIDERRSHVDTRPLRLVADAFLLSRRTITDPFIG